MSIMRFFITGMMCVLKSLTLEYKARSPFSNSLLRADILFCNYLYASIFLSDHFGYKYFLCHKLCIDNIEVVWTFNKVRRYGSQMKRIIRINRVYLKNLYCPSNLCLTLPINYNVSKKYKQAHKFIAAILTKVS